MSIQQPQVPQGYAQLSEDEPYSAASQNAHNNPMNFAGQGGQVIVQGHAVAPINYSAPMGNFEIYNPVPSPLEKLETCPYQCYKYWLVIAIVLDGLSILSNLGRMFFLSSELKFFVFCATICRGWEIYQFVQVYQGMQEKNVEKVNKGIYSMKIYVFALTIISFALMYEFYYIILEQAREARIRELEDLSPVGYGIFSVIVIIIGLGFWFLTSLFPAMKVRDILKSASGSQANAINRV